jgi:hypothetical protein
VVQAAALVGLVRLHATGGYCTVRHALVPGLMLTLCAASGLVWVVRRIAIDGKRLGLGEGTLRPGPVVWLAILGAVVVWPFYRDRTPYNTSFLPYRFAGAWLAERPDADGRVLDLTDWTLFFSGKQGDGFAAVLDALQRPATRYLVVRDAHLNGHLHYNEAVRHAIDGREPIARFPDNPTPRQIRVAVYDLAAPAPAPAGVAAGDGKGTRRQ